MNDKPVILIMIEHEEYHLDKIRDAYPGCELRIVPKNDQPVAVDPGVLRDVDVLIGNHPPSNFDDLENLRWVQIGSAGYAHITHLPFVQRGIRVSNALGVFDSPIAEWNIMTMLMWERRMIEQIENQRNRVWDRAARFQSSLFGRTIGFVGYGGIARETARLAKAMNLNVHAITRDGGTKSRELVYRAENTGDPEGKCVDRLFKMSDMNEFLRDLDYLIITVPHTPQTEGMIGEQQLRALKSSAVLMNPARAPIVNEQALIRCLEERWIRGASVDTHYAYPLPSTHPLWRMPNVVLTPHVAGSDSNSHYLDRIYDIFSQNLRRYLSNEPLLNALTEAQLLGQ